MYGGMGKMGRGGGAGGRGGGKRPLPPPSAHIQRVGPSPAAARLPLGPSSAAAAAPRGRHGGAAGTGRPGAALSDETFSMVSADTLDFAAIIRLTPDLVDEIRRLEAQGGAAKIKFNSNTNNLSGNVIDVGGKEFKFTWSRELGVCDIYEEVQNGEDGNGLLSECGSAWRKLNVQRILDESLKNQVKMRSEEAERRHKSRKSIVLDPANPSVKNQAKTMAAAAVEGNMRRMHWKKDQAFKKRKSESVPNAAAPRSVFRSGLPSNSSTGTMLSISPQPSPHEQAGVGASVSPFGIANLPRGHKTMDEDLVPLMSNGEDAVNPEKELSNKHTHGATRRQIANKGVSSTQPMDLRNLLINLLSDAPKGMTLKVLEKAVGEVIPNSGKKIESIIKTIATYQAPGRYILNSRIEMECPRRPSSENGSSPEHHVGNLPVTKLEKDDIEDNEHKIHSTPKPVESDINEKIDIEQNSPDQLTNDRKVNNEEGACSSSESGSDSDSESDSSDSGSDSGSQSRSRSKSQSPAGSGSASSSDSESDGSSSSKEGSDVDVDIMTSDDDKEEAGNTLPASSRLSPSPGENKAYDEKGKENVIETVNLDFQRASLPMTAHDYERGDGASAGEEIEGKSKKSRITTSENYEAATLKIVSDDFQMDVQNLDEHMALHDQYHQPVLQSISSGNSKVDKSEHVVRHGSTDKQCIRKDFNNLKQSDGTQVIPKAKPKRASDPKHFQEKPQSSKRPRATNTGADVSSGKSRDNSFAEKSRLVSPDRSETGQRKGQMMLTSSDMDQDRSTFDSQKDPDGVWAGRYMVHENAMRRKAFDGTEKSARYNDNNRTSRLPEKSYFHADETDTPGTRSTFFQGKLSMPKDKLHKEVRDVHMDANEKYSAKSLLDDAGGDKMPFVPDSLYRRSGDQNGAQKDTKLSLDIRKADIDKCVLNSEKGVSLRREPSDLELGEFREPLPNEDAKEGTRQFERKDSFKSADMKVNVMDNFSSDSNKRRTPSKVVRELKESPSVSKCVTQTKQDWPCRRMSEGDIMDSTAPQQRTTAQGQQFPRMDRPEHDFVSHLDGPSMSDIAIRSEIRNSRGGQENHVGSHRKTSTIGLPHQDPKHNGNHVACKTVMDSKPQKFNGLSNASDHKEIFQVESLLSEKRLDSSSDEDNSFYAKYDKNEPELRGPIKDYSQYKEYVQEYREKYDCYSSLDRHLEKYRNDFMKVGHDLEYLKIRDCEAYHNVGEQIIQMYHQCRKKHSRMKKIFIVLHDELKMLKQRINEFVEGYTKD